MTIKFRVGERRNFDGACAAISKLNAIFAEQYVYNEYALTIEIFQRTCAYCNRPHADHVPPKSQCLFAATIFRERTDEPTR